jgi:Trk K+ transport system NAD-binding subunit
VVHRRENLEDTIQLLTRSEVEELPVVDDLTSRRLVGTITRGDILELYDREILHKQILGIKLVHRDTQAADFVDLPAKYLVDLVPVGPSMEGRSLAELALRERFGVNVLAIKRPGLRVTGRNELPDPRLRLNRRDRLVVVGLREDVSRLKQENEA